MIHLMSLNEKTFKRFTLLKIKNYSTSSDIKEINYWDEVVLIQ